MVDLMITYSCVKMFLFQFFYQISSQLLCHLSPPHTETPPFITAPGWFPSTSCFSRCLNLPHHPLIHLLPLKTSSLVLHLLFVQENLKHPNYTQNHNNNNNVIILIFTELCDIYLVKCGLNSLNELF